VRHRGKAARWMLLAAAGSVLAGAESAQTHTADVLDLLWSAIPAPATRAVAARQGYPLGGVRLGDPGGRAEPGDGVVALVCLSSLDGRLAPRQWLIRLRLAAQNAPAGTREVTYYDNLGGTFVFHSAVTIMELETLGPVPAGLGPGAPVDAKATRIAVNTDFLALNLSNAANVIFQMHERAKKFPGIAYDLGSGTSRFSAGDVEAGRGSLAALNLTLAERRSFTGSLPALFQFLDIVRGTPDLEGILLQVLDKPSVIDVFRSGARANVNLNFMGAGPSVGREMFWQDPADREFDVVFLALEVFGKPALNVALYVTPPTPPLEVSAGILGVVAWSPSKPDKIVAVRVLSSAPGAVAAGAGSSPP
jgi:hypothetical protein